MLRQYVEQRVDSVVYGRLDELLRDGHCQGLLRRRLSCSVRSLAARWSGYSICSFRTNWTGSAADLLRATVDTVLRGDPLSRPGTDGAGLRAVSPTARDDDQEVGS